MIRKITVPKVSTNVEEITLTSWLRHEGDAVRRGEPIAELTTDKAAFELECPCSGVLRRILARPTSTLPVGYIIALVGNADDELPDVGDFNRKLLERHRAAVAARPAQNTAKAQAAGERFVPRHGGVVRATPAARRLAREKGVDLALVREENKAEIVTEEMVAAFARKKRGQ